MPKDKPKKTEAQQAAEAALKQPGSPHVGASDAEITSADEKDLLEDEETENMDTAENNASKDIDGRYAGPVATKPNNAKGFPPPPPPTPNTKRKQENAKKNDNKNQTNASSSNAKPHKPQFDADHARIAYRTALQIYTNNLIAEKNNMLAELAANPTFSESLLNSLLELDPLTINRYTNPNTDGEHRAIPIRVSNPPEPYPTHHN
jgi:hypothetical protein